MWIMLLQYARAVLRCVPATYRFSDEGLWTLLILGKVDSNVEVLGPRPRASARWQSKLAYKSRCFPQRVSRSLVIVRRLHNVPPLAMVSIYLVIRFVR